MKEHFFSPKRNNNTPDRNGYVLPLVIITGLILMVGAMIISARSFSSLIRSTRQRQGDEAIEIAETGASILINDLNSNFPYLLTLSCQVENKDDGPACKNKSWENFTFGILGRPPSACSGRSNNPKQIINSLDAEVPSQRGSYRLISYEFLGDQIQGGTAIIQVEGQRLTGPKDSQTIAASAVIEQEVTIAPKYCNLPPFTESSGSGSGFGLLSDDILLKKTSGGKTSSVLDQAPKPNPSQANVHCNNCKYDPEPNTPWRDVQCGPNCKIDGERSKIPPQPLPPAPRWDPTWGKKSLVLPLLDVQTPIYFGSVTINHTKITREYPGIPTVEYSLSEYCHTEDTSPPVTHCRMGNLQLSGGMDLTIDPGKGDIRFYFEGNKVSLSTNNVVTLGEKFGQVAFFGSEEPCRPELFDMSGSEALGPLFIQMPCTPIGLSGNGKIIGSVIAKKWDSNGFDLVIPPDAAQIIKEKYGISYGENEDREFAALGTNRWSLIQRQQ